MSIDKCLTGKKILEELDKYIISQDEAKRNVAISLRNRDRRKMIADENLRREITPKNIILVGSTGSGKTEIARRLAKIANAPFIKVEATKYTEVGYIGKDVESMIKDLLAVTITKMKEEKYKELEGFVYEIVIEKIAKIINPLDKIVDEEWERAKQRVRDGKCDNFEIEIEVSKKESDMPLVEVVAGGNEDDPNIDNFLEHVVGLTGKSKKITTTVKKAISILLEEELEKNLDLDTLIEEAIENVENNGIIFIDEIDKIIEAEGSGKGDVSRQGVQRDILPIIEGTTVMTKHGPVRTEHILFIAAGAFCQSSPEDLMPELQGRFPIKVKLKKLEKEDFVKILTYVEYNLLEQYKAMLEIDDVILNFTKSGIDKIAEIAANMNDKIENLGARRLATVIEEVLRDIMFEAPYGEKKRITIDGKFVKKIFKDEIEEENLDKFIL